MIGTDIGEDDSPWVVTAARNTRRRIMTERCDSKDLGNNVHIKPNIDNGGIYEDTMCGQYGSGIS